MSWLDLKERQRVLTLELYAATAAEYHDIVVLEGMADRRAMFRRRTGPINYVPVGGDRRKRPRS